MLRRNRLFCEFIFIKKNYFLLFKSIMEFVSLIFFVIWGLYLDVIFIGLYCMLIFKFNLNIKLIKLFYIVVKESEIKYVVLKFMICFCLFKYFNFSSKYIKMKVWMRSVWIIFCVFGGNY